MGSEGKIIRMLLEKAGLEKERVDEVVGALNTAGPALDDLEYAMEKMWEVWEVMAMQKKVEPERFVAAVIDGGRVTIPDGLREYLNIEKGTLVRVAVEVLSEPVSART